MKSRATLKLVNVLLLVFFLFALPFAFKLPNESAGKLIVLNMAIDKVEDDYEVSFQYLIPQTGAEFAETTGIVSEKAPTIAMAIERIEAKSGKSAGFSHTNSIIISDEVMKDNVLEVLDYCIRHKSIGNYSILIGTDGTGKELLEVASDPQNASVNSLGNIVVFNSRENLQGISTLQTFFLGYYSGNKTNMIVMLSLEEDKNSSSGQSESQSSGGQSSGGEGSGGQTSSGQDTGKKTIKNKGEVNVFKEGKFVTKLTSDENKGFNLIRFNATHATMVAEHIKDDYYDDATVTLSLSKDKLKHKVDFVDNTPIITYDIDLKATILSIYDGNNQNFFYNHDYNYITEEVKKNIEKQLTDSIKKSLAISKEYNVDLFEVYSTFNKYNHSEWQKYINSLDNPDDFIQNVQIFANIHISSD